MIRNYARFFSLLGLLACTLYIRYKVVAGAPADIKMRISNPTNTAVMVYRIDPLNIAMPREAKYLGPKQERYFNENVEFYVDKNSVIAILPLNYSLPGFRPSFEVIADLERQAVITFPTTNKSAMKWFSIVNVRAGLTKAYFKVDIVRQGEVYPELTLIPAVTEVQKDAVPQFNLIPWSPQT